MPQTLPVKTLTIKIRVDPRQKSDMEVAAANEGLGLSEWIRRLALRKADKLARAKVSKRK